MKFQNLANSGILAMALALNLPASPDTKAANKQPATAAKSMPMPSMLNTAPLEKLRKMTPAQREKMLSKLPAERQQALRQRLAYYESLTPQQRTWLDEQYKVFKQLSPERQEEMRRLYRRFNAVAENRKNAMQRELHSLRQMPDAERKARLRSKDFQARFSPQEQRLLLEMTETVSVPSAGVNAQ